MNIEEIKKNEEKKKKEMYNEAVKYRNNHKNIKKKIDRELINQRTIDDQIREVSRNPYFQAANIVHKSREMSTKNNTMKNKVSKKLLSGMEYYNSADALSNVSKTVLLPSSPSISENTKINSMEQRHKALRDNKTRKELLNIAKELRDSKGTRKRKRKRKRKKRKKSQSLRNRPSLRGRRGRRASRRK
jgi:hypothetical protein